MRTMKLVLAACIAVPLASAACAQGTAISPGQSIANQPGAPAASPVPPAAAAPAEARPRAARPKKAAKKSARKSAPKAGAAQ